MATIVQLYQHQLAGVPLRSFNSMMEYVEGTKTNKGLQVKAALKRGVNELGDRISNGEMKALSIEPHAVFPARNYTISPRPKPLEEISQLI